MPALTITAVDTATDQLTIAGHGLVTGDGPAAVRNVDGALPTGLAAVTDYWVIRVDANTVKLATSSANALAGTAIDITAAGSGTHILEVGIPYRRARTYVPKSVDVAGSQLKSADLNSKMDALQALHALLTGQSQSVWTIETLQAKAYSFTTPQTHYIHSDLWSDNEAATSFTTHTRGRGFAVLAASVTPIYCPIMIRNDETITQYRVSVQKNDTSNPITTQIVSCSNAGEVVETAGASSGVSAGAVAIDESGLSLAGGGKLYYVKITPGGTIIPSADRILFVRYLAKRV